MNWKRFCVFSFGVSSVLPVCGSLCILWVAAPLEVHRCYWEPTNPNSASSPRSERTSEQEQQRLKTVVIVLAWKFRSNKSNFKSYNSGF